MNAKPDLNKIKDSLNFHHFLPLNCARFKLVLCCVLNKFRTISPPTSCYRLGPCLSTPYRSWWSWSLPALKIGRRSRLRERKRSSNWSYLSTPTSFKIKFTLEKTWTRQQMCCWQKGGCRRRQRVRPRGGFKQHQGEVRSSGFSLTRSERYTRWPRTHD